MTATLPRQALAGPLATELYGRVAAAAARAQAVLGTNADGGTPADPESLHALIEALTEGLEHSAGAEPGAPVREQEAAVERLRHRYDTRFEALAGVHDAIDELRSITSPTSMLSQAPAALCGASKLRRVVLSLTDEGRLAAEAIHFDGDRSGASEVLAALRAAPMRLEHPLIETELLRRRRATIVDDAQVHPRVDRRLAELMGWTAYAAAPLVVGPHVIGMVHADRGPGQRLDVLDRDVLWE
ncbi:MAG: GAF domain-containing protein, partial [Solirubrobacteraceae bacterium]